MSLDDVTRFLDQVVSDPSIEAAMETAAKDKGDMGATAVALGQKSGLVFTKEEFVRAVDATIRQFGDMSEAELESVAGGFTPQPTPPASECAPNPDMMNQQSVRPPDWMSQGWVKGWG